MAKLADLSLDELYNRPKITPAAIKVIKTKEDFTKISPTYCEKVCKTPCYTKNPGSVLLETNPVDIMILHPYPAMDEMWKTGEKVDMRNNGIYSHMMRSLTAGTNLTWRIHNVLKCRPIPHNREQRDSTPYGERMPIPDNPSITTTTIERCAPYLLEEIKAAKPKILISTTTEVTKALGLKHVSNSADRGSVHYLDIDDFTVPVLLTRHPSILTMIRQNSSGDMWGPDFTSMISNDLHKAIQIAVGNKKVIPLEVALKRIFDLKQIVIPDCLEEAILECEVIKSQEGKGVIFSWDTETTSLDPWYEDARFLTHQFGYRRKDGHIKAVVLPLWHKDNHSYNPDDLWPHIADILENPDIPKVAHNAAFDVKYTRVTRNTEVKGLIADTMLLLHAINSGIPGNYGLKQSVWDYLYDTGLGGYESKLAEEYEKRVRAQQEEEKKARMEEEKAIRKADREARKLEKEETSRVVPTEKTPPSKRVTGASKGSLDDVLTVMERKK